jgi:hypothetical protein
MFAPGYYLHHGPRYAANAAWEKQDKFLRAVRRLPEWQSRRIIVLTVLDLMQELSFRDFYKERRP